VPSVGISEKFPADGSRVSGISRPPDRQNLNAEIQEKHLPKELTKLTKPPFGSFDSDHGSHISENLLIMLAESRFLRRKLVRHPVDAGS